MINFNVGVHFKMTTKGSRYSSKSDRSHVIAHASRYKGNNRIYYKNHNVDTTKSFLNDDYHTPYANVYQIEANQFKNKANNHDLKAKQNHNYKRCYGSDEKHISPVNGYLQQNNRWLKPLRTVPFKFCTMPEKTKLIHLCAEHSINYQRYATAINNGYRNYVNQFNQKYAHMKISRSITNLDEPGGDHAHIEYLALGTTAKGKPSMSFNRAVKQSIDGVAPNNYRKAMSVFRKQQAKALLANLSASFQQQGLPINFVLTSHARDPKTYINDMNLYKQTMRAVDQANIRKEQIQADAKQAQASQQEANHQAQIAQMKADKSFQALKRTVSTLKLSNDTLQNDNQNMINLNHKISHQNSTYQASITNLLAKLKKYQIQNQNLKTAKQNQQVFNHTVNTFKESLHSLVKRNISLTNQNINLQKQRPRIFQHFKDQRSIKRFKKEIKSLKNLNRLTQSACRDHLTQVLQNLPEKSTLMTQIEKLKRHVIDLRHSIGIHNDSIMRLKDYNHTLQKQLSQYKVKYSKWNKNLNIMIKNNNNWSQSLRQWNKALNNSSNQLNKANQTNVSLRQQLPNLKHLGKMLSGFKGLSEEDLAALIRLSEVNGNRSENGHRPISLNELSKLDQDTIDKY